MTVENLWRNFFDFPDRIVFVCHSSLNRRDEVATGDLEMTRLIVKHKRDKVSDFGVDFGKRVLKIEYEEASEEVSEEVSDNEDD